MDQPNSEIARNGGAEPSSAESESRFYEIADAAPVMIWISNADAACTWFNKVVLVFTGGRMEEGLGMGFLQYIHPEDQDVVRAEVLPGRIPLLKLSPPDLPLKVLYCPHGMARQ